MVNGDGRYVLDVSSFADFLPRIPESHNIFIC